MRYALICRDKPGAIDIRKANRADHLAHINESGVVEMAGPFLDETGEMCGSLVVLEVANKTEAQAWADNDPYAKAGLFDSVTIQAWNKVIG